MVWATFTLLPSANAQVWFKLELLPDEETYQVSMVSDTTWTFPYNLTSSAQVTIRAPHGEAPHKFFVSDLTALQIGSEWDANVYISAPEEAASWDYISFGLVSLGTDAFVFEEGGEVPLFSFKNGGQSCVDSIELMSLDDPFMPPNSQAINTGHSIVTFGGGLAGSFSGIVGNGKAPCTPGLGCEEAVTENEVSICSGENVMGFYPTKDTLISQHFISSNGCDSLVQTQVMVAEQFQHSQNVSVCLGGTYNGQAYYQDTELIEELTSVNGCDSILETYLSVLPHSVTNVDTLLCYGDMYGGMAVLQDTIIYNTLVAANGCDSIVTSIIELAPYDYIEKDTVLCQGTIFGGVVFDEDGWLEENWPDISGCDSLKIRTNVQVVPHSQTTLDEILTAGDVWNGVPYFNDTTIVEVFENKYGCDSTLTVHLKVFPPNTLLADTTICEGQTLQGQAIFNDTLLIETLPGMNLLVTDVTVIPSFILNIDTIICEGSWFNGQVVYEDTVMTKVFNGSSFCDSVVITEVRVLPNTSSTNIVPLCFGDLFEGVAYMADTVLVETLSSALGCDSTVYTDIRVIPEKTGYLETSICEGEAYNGMPIQQDTVLYEWLTAIDGCDSLLETSLTVLPLPIPEITGESAFCEGDLVELSVNGGGVVEWSTGATSVSILVAEEGTYSVTVADQNGCKDSVSFETSHTSLNAEAQVLSEGCNGQPNGTILFENMEGGVPPYLFSVDDGGSFTTDSIFTDLAAGGYGLVVQDVNGCEWQGNTEVLQGNLSLGMPNDLFLDLGDSAQLNLQIAVDYDAIVWSPADGLSCDNCPDPFVKPSVTTEYHVRLIALNGCEVEGTVMVYVSEKLKIYWPNAFSPNGDGINDRFYPFGGPDVSEVKRLQVFDRYGALIFEEYEFRPNDESFGWTGDGHGSGVYVFYAMVEFVNGREELFKGEIELIK